MAIAIFDENNKLHNQLFNKFKSDIVSQLDQKEQVYCQYVDYIDEIEIVLLNIATEELGLDEEFDEYCIIAISDPNPKSFKIVAGLEFLNYNTDNMDADFIKLEGDIYVEDNTRVILNIDQMTADYASSKDFYRARRLYS